jgi:hypothetical protein
LEKSRDLRTRLPEKQNGGQSRPNQYAFHRKLHRESKALFWKHTLFPYPVAKIPIDFFLSIILVIKHFCFSFRSNINLYFPFNLTLYIVSTSILDMYYILTWPKIGGWKTSIIIFKNVQWKSLSEKEIKKKKFSKMVPLIHGAIYGGKHIGLVISPLKSLMIDQCKQTKHVFAVYK